MLKRVLRRCVREPLTSLAAILFVAILSLIICFLHTSQEEELQNLTDTYYNTPITFEVCWLDGSRLYDSAPASGHFADLMPGLFLGNGRYKSNFIDLITDLQIRMTYFSTVGITSPEAANDQPAQFGESIEWYDGYDESIFRTDQLVCVVPSYDEREEVVITTSHNGRRLSFTLKVVGRYTTGTGLNYCPYLVAERLYTVNNMTKVVECLSGRLKNNDDLEKFKAAAAEWFATPNPEGEPTPWDNPFGYESYPLAMDIDDSQLDGLMKEMEKSMMINQIASILVFILATGAGFLTGFLEIRSRKREIALMRTVGVSNIAVCWDFALEQVLCVALGVLLGGSYALWAPAEKLAIFAGVYLVGLFAALLVFVRINLLATMKEDE